MDLRGRGAGEPGGARTHARIGGQAVDVVTGQTGVGHRGQAGLLGEVEVGAVEAPTDAQSLGVIHLPGPYGGICLDSPPDVASHARAFTLLKASALTPAATAQLLRDMAAR